MSNPVISLVSYLSTDVNLNITIPHVLVTGVAKLEELYKETIGESF